MSWYKVALSTQAIVALTLALAGLEIVLSWSEPDLALAAVVLAVVLGAVMRMHFSMLIYDRAGRLPSDTIGYRWAMSILFVILMVVMLPAVIGIGWQIVAGIFLIAIGVDRLAEIVNLE